MTVEAKIPLSDVKNALSACDSLYNVITNLEVTFDYKATVARKTLYSLIASIVKIALLVVFIVLAVNLEGAASTVCIILSVIAGILVLLDLFYRQKVSGKKMKKLRFRITYYIKCFIQDIYEFGCFKKNFGLNKSALGLIFTKSGRAEACAALDDYGFAIGKDYLNYIRAYNAKYENYRDYTDLSRMWNICGRLLEIINSGRATDIQSALAVVDREEHNKKMRAIAQEKANRIAAAAERAADAQAAAADRAAAAVEHDASENDKLRDDIRREYDIPRY